MSLMKYLEELCALRGISGDETSIASYLKKEIGSRCESIFTDALGNLIVVKKGKAAPKNKLMICAHMDEVGFIVSYILEDGSLRFANVGGVDPAVTVARQVYVGPNKIPGVIGEKAIHHLSDEEKKAPPKTQNLSIDIGAANREEAEKVVSVGDCVTFAGGLQHFGADQSMLLGRAIDDRGGCAVMLQLIQEELPYDCTFVFTTQEEVGCRGAKTAAFAVEPDIAIILESTTAADIPGSADEKKVCLAGHGAVVSFMDGGTIYDRELYALAFAAAKEKNIPVQTKTMVAGGNDSGAIHVTGKGTRTLAISSPCRYLHSASSVVTASDVQATLDLSREMIARLGNL